MIHLSSIQDTVGKKKDDEVNYVMIYQTFSKSRLIYYRGNHISNPSMFDMELSCACNCMRSHFRAFRPLPITESLTKIERCKHSVISFITKEWWEHTSHTLSYIEEMYPVLVTWYLLIKNELTYDYIIPKYDVIWCNWLSERRGNIETNIDEYIDRQMWKKSLVRYGHFFNFIYREILPIDALIYRHLLEIEKI